MKKQNRLTTVGLDILLITLGTLVFSIGVEAILVHQKFIKEFHIPKIQPARLKVVERF